MHERVVFKLHNGCRTGENLTVNKLAFFLASTNINALKRLKENDVSSTSVGDLWFTFIIEAFRVVAVITATKVVDWLTELKPAEQRLVDLAEDVVDHTDAAVRTKRRFTYLKRCIGYVT